ncbi:septum site-determining protein Ssd, partial [Arthrobacter sp. H5]|uniref:septum site-determining protein Ssd n=1 Tax=Arthrobacter sp. H5 TaxID=1267973 RepID=UPI0009DE4996
GRLRAGTAGHVLGVLGSSGGAGATTVSCWVAAHSAASGTPTLLVDGDPLGGGLELAAGLESQPGVRWPDVGEVRGTLNPAQLAEALPSVDGLSILSMGVDPPEPGVLATPAVPSVMQAASNAFELTVVDLARGWSVDGSLLPYCDSFLLVIPGRLRAISAARALVPQLRPVPVLALVRGPVGPDLDPLRIAETAGCPLAGHLPHLRGTSSAENQGRLLEMRTQRSVRRLADAVLRALSSPGTPVMP